MCVEKIIYSSANHRCDYSNIDGLAVINNCISFASAQPNEQYSFLRKWGSGGVSFGEFSQPLGIAIDSSGNVYVTDSTAVANKIQKVTSSGTFITSWER
jgi:DNA-binding beta-propeller fold protein YncE